MLHEQPRPCVSCGNESCLCGEDVCMMCFLMTSFGHLVKSACAPRPDERHSNMEDQRHEGPGHDAP